MLLVGCVCIMFALVLAMFRQIYIQMLPSRVLIDSPFPWRVSTRAPLLFCDSYACVMSVRPSVAYIRDRYSCMSCF